MRSRTIIIGFCIVLLLLLVGCDDFPIVGKATDVGGKGSPSQSGGDVATEKQQGPPQEDEEFFGGNRSGSGAPDSGKGDTDSGDGAKEDEQAPRTESKSYCGDGVCDQSENCDGCDDCVCEEGALCYQGGC